MRIVCIIALLCTFGCAQRDQLKTTADAKKQAHLLVTLGNLVYVDALSEGIQHPLVCGADRDFPVGRELAFRQQENREFVHAVFPADVTPPKTLDGKFVLHGYFQGIQNMSIYKFKKPKEDYRYFVVSSWEYQK